MFLLVCIILVLFPAEASQGAREGLKTAFETVIPSILPFAVFSSALIFSGSAITIGKFLSPLWRLLGLHPYGAIAFTTGLLGGYPTGCKSVCDMYKEQLITKSEAEAMLSYTNNGGLIFALTIGGKLAFSSSSAGIIMFFSGVIAAIITGIILAPCKNKTVSFMRTKKPPIMAVLGKSISSGGEVIVNILASFVVFYSIVNALMLDKFSFLAGVMELTKGITFSGKMNNLPLAALFFSFGGLCVFAQSAAICASCNLSLKKYILGKVLSGVLAFFITYAILNVFNAGKEILLFSFLAIISIICAMRLIKTKLRNRGA